MKRSSKTTSPDGFVCDSDHPLAAEHAKLDDFLKAPGRSTLAAESGRLEKAAQVALLLGTLERIEFQKKHGKRSAELTGVVKKLAGRTLPYTEEQLVCGLTYAATILSPKDPEHVQMDELDSPIPGVVPALLDQIEFVTRERPLSKAALEALARLHAAIKPMEFWGGYKKTVERLETLVAQKQAGLPDEGESWAEAIRKDIESMTTKKREQWLALLQNAPKGTGAKPSAKWRAQADSLLAAVGKEEFARQIEQWFGLVGARATARIQPRNAALLRSLVWYASLLTGETVCRALANAVEGGLRKLAGGNLYASSISKASIAALEAMTGMEPIAQLSRLKHRVKSPWGLQEIENAFTNAVQRSGISRAEIEEISLPTFGLDAQGTLRRQTGKFSGKLSIVGSAEVQLEWFDADGKKVAKPSLTKTQAAEEKALKQLARDIEKFLGAQRDRVENFLERDRIWMFDIWKARYLEHPLMAQLSQRLIWQFNQGQKTAAGIWRGGRFVQADGKSLDWLGSKTEVRLWRPLGVEPTGVQAWRRWLEEHQVTQPFKQAHREIYLLTDAERATATYSNRFAAHILRQHQFKALCEQRGWKSEFLGSWDPGGSVPAREMPGWGLRAEFWIEVAGDEFAASGVALHVATDQVRFSNQEGSVVELTEVPALVFSEIMRDVDLFVSVCTVGNDPTWADAGAERPRDYWRDWSFGALNATAATRRDILERLVPKLKIAGVCSLADRYLVVRGTLRTYKIHLGSGNILMEPNDEYLCIVPDRKQPRTELEKVFLPFEGDNLLSVIISKAFLLAADDRISDQTIVKQITAKH